jgi:hypothetical protein
MTAKRKPKKTETITEQPQPALPPPTPKEVDAIAHASNRLSKRRKRVQVTMKMAGETCQISHAHSDGRGWSAAMTNAFGTTSEDFVDFVFHSAMNAVSVPETSQQNTMNGLVAAIDGVEPKDEIEAMLASQMAVTHSLAMEFLGRTKRAQYIPQLAQSGNLAVKLLRTYTAQVEALAKLRRGGEQKVTVEHVHVHSGGQAIVGNVTPGGGATARIEDQPDAKQVTDARQQTVWRSDPTRDILPIACDAERPLPHARRPVAGCPQGE